MIFRQIDEILSGQKPQTRRVCKPSEQSAGWAVFSDGNITGGRVKWAVGHTYAVVPKRGQPGIWWKEIEPGRRVTAKVLKARRAEAAADGWQPMRIRITAIRRERLQDISQEDAWAEGMADAAAYHELWQSINTRKGTRWTDNPAVWAIHFELVK